MNTITTTVSGILKKRTLLLRVCIFFFLSLYSYVLYLHAATFLDPDLGWHLASGKYILEHGIPATDPFSYSMSSYPIIDHEWLTNIVLVTLYNLIGISGLSLIWVTLFFSTVLMQIPRNLWRWSPIPLLFTVTILSRYFLIRTQVLSWLFFSLLLAILFTETRWKKYKVFLPVLMLVWANTHGSFMLGIGVLTFFVFLRLFERKTTISDGVIVIASALSTLITPYGFRLWQEVWMQSTDMNMHLRYGEWMPLIFRMNTLYLYYFIFFIGCMVAFHRNVAKSKLIILFTLLLASFSSLRHFPFFIIAILSILIQSTRYFHEKNKHTKAVQTNIFAGSMFLSIVVGLMSLYQLFTLYTQLPYEKEEVLYPSQALLYLHTHIPKKQLLSVFEWGGYVVWKYPEKKVYLDGMMPNWRLAHPSRTESASVYNESDMLFLGQMSLQSIVQKYDIDTLLLHTTVSSLSDASNATYPASPYIFPKEIHPKYPPIEKQLALGGWKIIYQDPVATIYKLLPKTL